MGNELHLDEFVIKNHKVTEEGVFAYLVSAVEPADVCYQCGSNHIVKNGGNRLVRDLPAFGHPVWIQIQGIRYLCRDCGKSFSHEFEAVDDGNRITVRLRKYIEERCLTDTITRLAKETNVSNQTVFRIADEYIERRDEARTLYSPSVLGIDEVHLNDDMCCVFTDIVRRGIIEILPARTKIDVVRYLKSLPDRDKIRVVTMDMWRPYKSAVNEVLPDAVVVIDKYHVITLATNALDTERKRISEAFNVKSLRWSLRKNREDLSPAEFERLKEAFVLCPILQTAYELKESFRAIYNAEDRKQANELFEEWANSIPEELPAFLEVADTVRRWEQDIFAYFDHRYTNGVTESLNNVIKSINKQGRGYSFQMLRGRVLYGTSATKMPRYKEPSKKQVRGLFDSPVMYMAMPMLSSRELEHGDYVSIDELAAMFDAGIV